MDGLFILIMKSGELDDQSSISILHWQKTRAMHIYILYLLYPLNSCLIKMLLQVFLNIEINE